VVEELIANLHDALSDRSAHAHGDPVPPLVVEVTG
jgi:hypothetical protein